MSLILPNLYLGSLKVAQDPKFLKDKKIKHVLSCGLFSYPPGNLKFLKRRKELPMKDNHIEPVLFYFQESFDFITSALAQNEAVLVHCLKGMSRSASIVISYILRSSYVEERPLTLAQAIKFVSERHPQSFPNKHFLANLAKLER